MLNVKKFKLGRLYVFRIVIVVGVCLIWIYFELFNE